MTKEKEITKTKNSLSTDNSFKRNLSIQLSLDGFSFCVYTSHSNEILHFDSFKFENEQRISPYRHLELIETIFNSENSLNDSFNLVNVIHFNNLVAQVPKAIFNKNNLADYLKYTVKVLENDFITYDELPSSEIVNVYIPFVNINNFIFDKFGAFNYRHSSSVLINKLINQNKQISNTLCFVHVVDSSFEIVVLKNNKLLLYNNFSFKTKEDFIYYILFVAEQLHLNPEEFELYLLGDIEKESELFSITYKYIRNVKFYENHSNQLNISELSPHSHFTLLNIN